MDISSIFNNLLINPILNLLIVFYNTFMFLKIPGALGLAVIALTVLIRLILHPLTVAQLKSAQKMALLKPEMDKLNAKYKDDKSRLSQEQLRLYKDAGVNPAAGCLPLLLQFPILIALYNVFFQVLSNTDSGKVVESLNNVLYPFLNPIFKVNSLDFSFFGLNLVHKPNEWQKFGWWLLLVPVITGVLQYVQTKMMTPKQPVQNSNLKVKKENVNKDVKEEKKEDDMSVVMQKQMSIMMPLMIGIFAYSFPLGLSLYWNTFTVFGIIQQLQVNKNTDVTIVKKVN